MSELSWDAEFGGDGPDTTVELSFEVEGMEPETLSLLILRKAFGFPGPVTPPPQLSPQKPWVWPFAFTTPSSHPLALPFYEENTEPTPKP